MPDLAWKGNTITQIELLLQALTLEEKAQMCAGGDF